jgi:DNA-directed RNA polymerase specialized sigma24 family protein
MTEVKHGYTIADIDSIARAAVRADRSLASDAHTRYDVAWSAIALALTEADHWPRREHLVRTGWQAIYDEVRQMRHTFGFAGKDGTRGVASSPRFREFWWHGTVQFEDQLVERLAVAPIIATLTDTERAAVIALAVHDDYLAAADALGLKMSTLTVRLSNARRRFCRRWFYPEAPPKVKGTDRRVEAHGKPPATHCGSGHEWTPENTRWRKSQSGRTCRACERARARPSRAKAPT